MAGKRRPRLTPDMSEYLGLDAQGRHCLAWASRSRPGVRHFTLGVYNRALSCTCEAYVYHPETPCAHMLAYPDALRHHLDPPPADPDGAAPDRAQADLDADPGDWILGGKLSPPPWLVAPGERRRHYDEAMRDLYGES